VFTSQKGILATTAVKLAESIEIGQIGLTVVTSEKMVVSSRAAWSTTIG